MSQWSKLREEADEIEGQAYESALPILQEVREKCAISDREDNPEQRKIRIQLMDEYNKIVSPFLIKALKLRQKSWEVVNK